MEEKKLPKKIITNDAYAETAKKFIIKIRDDAGGAKAFFKLVYDREPIGHESGTLNNYVIRGKYSADFVGLLIDRFELENVTLGEFYKGNKK